MAAISFIPCHISTTVLGPTWSLAFDLSTLDQFWKRYGFMPLPTSQNKVHWFAETIRFDMYFSA
jgi:hypothetical protein